MIRKHQLSAEPAQARLTRLRRAVWNWLPAFLEVAEVGSVVRAAGGLSLTPAAVSRTIGLLEDAIGASLFTRVGRKLVLNGAGAALRVAVRGSVGQIERGLDEAVFGDAAGELRVASLGVLTEYYVIPALLELVEQHPGLVPQHDNLRTADANSRLARGELDVAFVYEEVVARGVSLERIGAIGKAVYCGRRHPLFARRRVTHKDIMAHAFSVPQIGDSGRPMDGWPIDVPRHVGMRITMLRSNLAACRSGRFLTVLPDVVASAHVKTKELRRLGAVELSPIEVFAAQPIAGQRERTRWLIDLVRRRVASKTE